MEDHSTTLNFTLSKITKRYIDNTAFTLNDLLTNLRCMIQDLSICI